MVSACESVAGKSDDAKCLCAESVFSPHAGKMVTFVLGDGKRKERKEFQAPVIRDSGEKACSRFPRGLPLTLTI